MPSTSASRATPSEADRVEWVAVDEVRALVGRGEVRDGLSLTALLWALAFGPLAGAR
jgi:hypothetical protein